MNENANETMGAIIARKRKELGMTQEQLASALGISYQAVSKWENELSSPDISALPLLADRFGITIDELFGREAKQGAAPEISLAPVPVNEKAGAELPWPDDNTLHAVLFEGHKLVGHESAGDRIFSKRQITFRYEGDALNVQSDFDVTVEGEVRGSVQAGGDIDCETVYGSVSAGGDVDCGEVFAGINAGGDVNCGDVDGNLSAGGDVDCGHVEGNLNAGGDVDCGNVKGDIRSGGDIDCRNVGGSVHAEGDVKIG